MALPLVLAGCDSKSESGDATEVETVELVALSPVEEMVIPRTITLSSTLKSYETINVSPSITGTIEHIYVEEGSKVKKGDLLVRMDQTQYNNYKLSFANLGVEMARMDALKSAGNIAQQTYDQTKVQYDQTRETLEFYKSNTFVKAPFSGVISAKNYEDGELFSGAAGPVVVLCDISKLKALVNIPEKYFSKVKEGMLLEIKSEAYPDKIFQGTVEIVFPTIDAATHTFQAKVVIPNKSEELRPGMYVNSNLYVGEEKVLVVPYQSVLKMVGANNRYLFINENGVAKRVEVELGARHDKYVEIVKGDVNPGDELVVLGQGRLVDGVKIKEQAVPTLSNDSVQ